MQTSTNIIRTTAIIIIMIVTTANFAHAGSSYTKKSQPTASKQVNPNFDPNKKLLSVRSTPLINRNRQQGESFLNRNREPLFNRKYVPKKYTKAEYYK